jgi:predicted nucleotidyltransferase
VNEAVRNLAQAGVRFIVMGGHAIRYIGFARPTMDWDLFIPPHDHENFRKINQTLDRDLDMDVVELGPRGEHFIQTFQTQWATLQFHLIVAGVPSYDEAEANAVTVVDDGVAVKRLSGSHLLATKEKANRAKDEDDLTFLRKLQRNGLLD